MRTYFCHTVIHWARKLDKALSEAACAVALTIGSSIVKRERYQSLEGEQGGWFREAAASRTATQSCVMIAEGRRYAEI